MEHNKPGSDDTGDACDVVSCTIDAGVPRTANSELLGAFTDIASSLPAVAKRSTRQTPLHYTATLIPTSQH